MRPAPSPPQASQPNRRAAGPVLGGLILLLLLVVGGALWRSRTGNSAQPAASPDRRTAPGQPTAPAGEARGAALSAEELRAFSELERDARQLDSQLWRAERLAETRGAWVDALWERLQTSEDALRDLAALDLPGWSCPPAQPSPEILPHAIRRWRSTGPGPGDRTPGNVPAPTQADAPRHPALALAARRDGWRLTASEWRQVRFQPGADGASGTSWYDVHLDLSLARADAPARASLEARVRLVWGPDAEPPGPPREVAVESWNFSLRSGEPAFREAQTLEITPLPRTYWIDPLLVQDPGPGPGPGTGTPPRLILLARNAALTRQPDGVWSVSPLTSRHPGLLFTGTLADFDGDGLDDLLVAVRSGLLLLRGSADGRFEDSAETVWAAPARLQYVQALACGDIDADGDLDVFLAQYRTPYEGGQMPRPYFDALDGHPSYLLRNDGRGRFQDATAGSGLEPSRLRRSYGASFVDLDGDSDLDLVVTSDFAGLEAHLNEGRGTFRKAPAALGLEGAKGFGMSHTFSDFDADGSLDVLMVAMPQWTAGRLDALGLEHPSHPGWREERRRMTAGNRLFLGPSQAGGTYRAADPGRAVAWTGWAWSAAAFDLDHGRHPALHVVNGHETRQSVRDYETEFWTRDIYLPDTVGARVADAWFASRFADTRGRGWSYGGHDRNRLVLPLGDGAWIEAGHLLGVGLGADSRNVVAEDFDGDGDVDLAVTTFEIWPRERQTLRIYENRLPTNGQHWIGLRILGPHGGRLPPGTSVRLVEAGGRAQARTVVTGDGYRSQAGGILRFGLGDSAGLHSVEISQPSVGKIVIPWDRTWGVDQVVSFRLPVTPQPR